MYKHILISTDGSDVARKGVEHGLALAKAVGAKVTVVTVSEPFPFHASVAGAGWVPTADDVSGYEAAQKDYAGKVLAAAKAQADGAGVTATTLHVPDAWPAEAIVDTAKTAGCDLIVMASHGRRGLGRLILGSQAAEVLAQSAVPVLVVR